MTVYMSLDSSYKEIERDPLSPTACFYSSTELYLWAQQRQHESVSQPVSDLQLMGIIKIIMHIIQMNCIENRAKALLVGG